MSKRGRPQKLHKTIKTSGCVPPDVLTVLQEAHQKAHSKESFSEWWEREMTNGGFDSIQMTVPRQTDGWIHPSFFLTPDFWGKVDKYMQLGYSKRSIILSGCYALYEKYKK